MILCHCSVTRKARCIQCLVSKYDTKAVLKDHLLYGVNDVAAGEYECDSLHSAPTGSEEGSGSIVHGQSMDQLPGRGAQRPPLKQGEGEGRVV